MGFNLLLAVSISFLGMAPRISEAAPALSLTEVKVVDGIDAHLSSWGLPFLQQTVEINSGTLNREGVLAAAAVYEKRLKELGFETTTVDLKSVNRGCHLFAEHKGKPGAPRILLIGHLDTVFEKGAGFLEFKKLADEKLSGPGISDMKGGNLVILESLEALRAAGQLDSLNILVAMTGDEEAIGRDADGSFATSRGPFIELAKRSDYALGFEPMNKSTLAPVVARRSSSSWKMQLTAKPGHSSLVFSKLMGPGAAFPVAQILNRFYKELRSEKFVTFNIGTMVAGSTIEHPSGKESSDANVTGKANIIPAVAQVTGDIRTLSLEALTRTRAKMQRIVETEIAKINRDYDSGAAVSAEITFKDSYPPMSPTPGNHKLLQQLSRVSEDLGLGKMVGADPMLQGASDISFAAQHVIGALDGLGPSGFDYHTHLEQSDIPSLKMAVKRAALMIYRLHAHAQGPKPGVSKN